LIEPLKTYSGVPISGNAEIERHLLAIHQASGGKGTWLLDRGFDRRNLFTSLLQRQVAFVARLLGDRHVQTAEGRTLAVMASISMDFSSVAA